EGYNTIQLEDLVKSIGVKHISVINPYNLKKSIATTKEALEFEGVSVIISRKKCTLYAKSLKQLKPRSLQTSLLYHPSQPISVKSFILILKNRKILFPLKQCD
ncbi:hypothetical protein KKA14_07565, partial [bacterium]|nr:hypothetical protein [bacterium]